MIHILLGEDTAKKDQYLTDLKSKHFVKSPSAVSLDCEILFGDKLPEDDLKKALWALPAAAAQRFVAVHEAHRLSAHHEEIIEEFIERSFSHAVVVLESSQADALEGLIKKFRSKIKVVLCAGEAKPNVFDLTRMMSMGRSVEALQVLHELMKEGVHPLQIMGGIVWYWGKSRQSMSRDVYRKGLLALKQADENIKRSRLDGASALELLIVKLSAA